MEIWENRQGEVVILAVHGKLDAATSPLFEAKLRPMLARGERNFLLDFTHLDYISSAALRQLLLLAKKADEAGGKVVLASLKSNIREIFDMAGFTQIFPIHVSQEEALRSF
ncbi:MAG: STAS domain-containing protein [Syntrophales bacterium]|jgi:anti-anti-sigma factor|nr:STAS domain-containing protein [Syntrophales bacterium]